MKSDVKAKKKLLILGATINQLPLVMKAKNRRIYTITADNVPENICHKYSDEFLNISTPDRDQILKYAKSQKIDGIITCASDLALPTVSYISNKMNLSSVSNEAVLTTINKDLFRKFQVKHQIKCPKSYIFLDMKKALTKYKMLSDKKWVVKPVDSSGSKGVSLIKSMNLNDYKQIVQKAFSFSRCNKIIIEEYITGLNCSIDGFINNGKIGYMCITNKYLTPSPGLIPVCHTLPSKLPKSIQYLIKKEIIRILRLLKVETSPFDFDIIVSDTNEIYVLEMSLRVGGNCIPHIIKYSYGEDIYEQAISFAVNEKINYQNTKRYDGYTGVFLIRSPKSGILNSISSKEFLYKKYGSYIKEIVFDYSIGNKVAKFTQGNNRLGHVILQAPSELKLHELYEQIYLDLRLVIK